MALSRQEIERRRRRMELMRRGRGVVVFRSKLNAGAAEPPAPPPFTPTALFTTSEQGAWYDPSDLDSMAQNSNGTGTTAVGQPVGLLYDKRLDTTWKSVNIGGITFSVTQGDGVLSVSGNQVTITGATTMTRVAYSTGGLPNATIPGMARATVRANYTGATGVQFWLRGAPAGIANGASVQLYNTITNSSFDVLEVGTGTVTFTIEDLSSWRGNHLVQATTSSKPVLRQSGALYYLEFDGFDDGLRGGSVPGPYVADAAIALTSTDDTFVTLYDHIQQTKYAAVVQINNGSPSHNAVGTPVTMVDGIDTSLDNRDTLYQRFVAGSVRVVTIKDVDLAGFLELSFFGYTSFEFGGNFFGAVINPANASQRANVLTFLASKQGRTL